MFETIIPICGIIAGIILGVIIYKKLPKRFFTPILHVVVLIIYVLLIGQIASHTKETDFMRLSMIFFLVVLVVSLTVNFLLFLIYKIIKKIKDKKKFQAAAVAMIFPIIIIIIYLIVNIMSIAGTNSYDKEANNVKNWFRCKILFGDWILHRGSYGGLYECGFERTSDGGKMCETSNECELDCVEYNPAHGGM